jgi:hypothetical protein
LERKRLWQLNPAPLTVVVHGQLLQKSYNVLSTKLGIFDVLLTQTVFAEDFTGGKGLNHVIVNFVSDYSSPVLPA